MKVLVPILAPNGQPLALIRQQMLLNSFSYLPAKKDSAECEWYFVADYAVAQYLRAGQGKDRKKRLADSLEYVIDNEGIELIEARCCHAYDPLEKIIEHLKTTPWLVVDDQDPSRLLGIMTGFDVI